MVTHPHVAPEWLALRQEDILEPDQPIIDPHHHLWERSGGYFARELMEDLGAGHRVEATVHVQCHHGYRGAGPDALRPVGETQFAVRMANEALASGCRTQVCAGIVGFADLQLGAAVDEVLMAHIEAGQGRFRGVRRLSATDTAVRTHLPPLALHLLADAAFRQGFARLQPLGLSFDAWLFHPQIDELASLASAFPDTAIVLDHLGTPLGVGSYRAARAEVFAAWRSAMAELARRPNVSIKLGGLAMALVGFDFHEQPLPPASEQLAQQWRPYIENCIELFGVDRCMFESNFPVDKGMCSYAVLWNAFKRITRGASQREKDALFHDTAARFYRLQPVPTTNRRQT